MIDREDAVAGRELAICIVATEDPAHTIPARMLDAVTYKESRCERAGEQVVGRWAGNDHEQSLPHRTIGIRMTIMRIIRLADLRADLGVGAEREQAELK